MKKILRRVFLSIFIVLILGGAVAVYFIFFHGSVPVRNDPYITDPAGTSYLVVEGENGTTYAAVTDSDGNIYAAQINDDGSIGETIGQINDQVQKEKLPTNYTGATINDTANANDFTGAVSIGPTEAAPVESTTAPQQDEDVTTSAAKPNGKENKTTTVSDPVTSTTKAGQKPTKAATTEPAGTTYRIDKYQKMFESGQYMMVFQTDDETLGDTPITAAVKNGNVLIDTQMESWKIKMLYTASDDTTYILIDSMKKYCKVPKDVMGEEFDMSELMAAVPKQSSEDLKITQSKATINGKSLNCETVTNSDGTQTQYYFDGDTLVRIDSIDSNGESSSIYISSITSEVPDSMFEIPSNYRPLNIPWKLLMES